MRDLPNFKLPLECEIGDFCHIEHLAAETCKDGMFTSPHNPPLKVRVKKPIEMKYAVTDSAPAAMAETLTFTRQILRLETDDTVRYTYIRAE